MARRFLLVAAVAWLVAGAAALLTAVTGREALLASLPPLAIDADALGGALTAMGIACATIGLLHGWLVVGLARNGRWPRTASVLLACVLGVVFLALAAAAAASAARESELAPWLWTGCLAACLVAIGYGWTAAELIAELRSGPAI